MAGGEWHDDHLAAPRLHFRGADDCRLGIVATLGDDVGFEVLDEVEWRVFGKDDNKVDAFKRGNQVRAIGVAPNRARRPLEASDRVVAVETDY
jgi:hypothetical protein